MRHLSHRSVLTALALSALLAGGAAVSAPVGAQASAALPRIIDAATVPFGVGELAMYQVKLGRVSVGEGSMEVVALDTIQGNPVYHTRLTVKGGIPLARVDDKFDSWIDVKGLFSRRFKQNQRELSFRRNREYEFFSDRQMFRRENGEVGSIPTDRPLDEVSFLYYVRTLPLRVGETYRIPRYFKDDGNPVVLEVLRKETITVPAGTYNTIVVRPIIQTDGLFSQGGEAEVYFTDDSRRLLVQLRTKVPLVGSLNLYLKSYEEGRMLPGVTAAAR